MGRLTPVTHLPQPTGATLSSTGAEDLAHRTGSQNDQAESQLPPEAGLCPHREQASCGVLPLCQGPRGSLELSPREAGTVVSIRFVWERHPRVCH